ncbi:flagellar hook-associated protein 1 FlgK [Oxalobacteraceae bacterium GrIS 1.11]
MADLLNIGKSGLLAAQVGLATTGHNISNANVDGYSRQVVIQGAGPAQGSGGSFVGSGTEVAEVKRIYDNFLASQVRSAQSGTSSLDAYNAQISQIDNMMADPTTGLSPALQGFFNGVQDVSANPASTASRQAMLSSATTLASTFQGVAARLSDIGAGVNSQIASNVGEINSYGQQIAQLNDAISRVSGSGSVSGQPNDLLDKRDQLVNELNKLVKATATPGDNNTVNISIGSGQPLVVSNKSFQLAATPSQTDPGRVEVGYVNGNNSVTVLPENALTGGSLGGLLEFRANTLDKVQNSIGRTAIALASTFNAQHQLGQDQAGAPGGNFFTVAPVAVSSDSRNNPTSTTAVTAVVSDPTKLTASNYAVKFDGTNFVVSRQSDGQSTVINPYPQVVPQTIDGVDFSITGAAAQGDNFSVKPTVNGAAAFDVALSDPAKIAVAAPIITARASTNTGSASISQGSVDKNYLTPGNALVAPVTLTYTKASATLSGFPPTQAITVTNNGASTVYPAGTASIPYQSGDKINFGGVNVAISGTPGDQDKFTIGPNVSGVGDNRNGALLGALQTTNILDGGATTLQGSYAQTVNFVGNKTREVQANDTASQALLTQTTASQQSVSGVNLDEEAANLLKYQQAYQASGKVMQIASQLFSVLLTLGGA